MNMLQRFVLWSSLTGLGLICVVSDVVEWVKNRSLIAQECAWTLCMAATLPVTVWMLDDYQAGHSHSLAMNELKLLLMSGVFFVVCLAGQQNARAKRLKRRQGTPTTDSGA